MKLSTKETEAIVAAAFAAYRESTDDRLQHAVNTAIEQTEAALQERHEAEKAVPSDAGISLSVSPAALDRGLSLVLALKNARREQWKAVLEAVPPMLGLFIEGLRRDSERAYSNGRDHAPPSADSEPETDA